MYTIASVEDSNEEFQALENAIDRFNRENGTELRLTRFPSSEAFLAAYDCNYDVIFLDIALPGMSGMELADAIRRMDASVEILFLTSLAQFAVKGYEVEAFDFLVKPIVYGDFAFKAKRLIKRLDSKGGTKVIISSAGKQFAISSNEIYFVEISGHTLVYHTSSGDYEVYETLRNVEEKLAKFHFARCNSCYLVNLAYVDGVEGHDLKLGKYTLAISHPKKKDFMKTLNAYYGKGSN